MKLEPTSGHGDYYLAWNDGGRTRASLIGHQPIKPYKANAWATPCLPWTMPPMFSRTDSKQILDALDVSAIEALRDRVLRQSSLTQVVLIYIYIYTNNENG